MYGIDPVASGGVYWLVISIPILLIFVWILYFCIKRKRRIDISDIADYIQTRSTFNRFPIIAKLNKMGVYDIEKRTIAVPIKYDSLEWRERGKILVGNSNGKKVYIDIHGNEFE